MATDVKTVGRVWLVVASDRDPSHGWHWRGLFLGPSLAGGYMRWGGSDWIRSPLSRRRISEMAQGDLVLAYQAGEGIVGLARLASDGYSSSVAGEFDSFNIALSPKIRLDCPLPFRVMSDIPLARRCEFVRVKRGTVFQVTFSEFRALVEVIFLLNVNRIDEILRLINAPHRTDAGAQDGPQSAS